MNHPEGASQDLLMVGGGTETSRESGSPCVVVAKSIRKCKAAMHSMCVDKNCLLKRSEGTEDAIFETLIHICIHIGTARGERSKYALRTCASSTSQASRFGIFHLKR